MNYTDFERLIESDYLRRVDKTHSLYVSRDGELYNLKKKEITKMKLNTNKNGYVLFYFYEKGVKLTKHVHRLVAETFLPNPCNLEMVNHKDEIRNNNKVDNLEWCDRAYNTTYNGASIRSGLNRRKKVAKINKDGVIIKIYDSITEAILDGFHGAAISKTANDIFVKYNKKKKYRDHKGYYWRYVKNLSETELTNNKILLQQE